MSLLLLPNPVQVNLQTTAISLDGQPKADVVSGTVRVYHVAAGVEVADLALTALARVGTTTTWRLAWGPMSLPAGHYVAEYRLVDSGGRVSVTVEDVAVHDLAQQADLALVRQVETGRWQIVANQMIFYATDGTTPLLTFDLTDADGDPSMDSVFQRVPA
jgi:hypothetical protein